MKVAINKSVLESMLINAQSFIEKKDQSQITSHILIHLEEDLFQLKSTDYEIGLYTRTRNANISDVGVATANGKKLLDIIKILKDDEVILETIKDYLYIKQRNSKYRLPMYNSHEFPEFPTLENKTKIDINNTQLVHKLKKILPAIDNNNPKYELNGALLDISEEGINIVATDTKRLAIANIENTSSEKLSIIIPKKAIGELQKLYFDDIELYFDQNTLIVKSSNFEFFTKLINGKFPDYQRIIPKDSEQKIILSREKIIEAIKQISIISNEMKISIKQDGITFESLNEDNIEAKTAIEAEFDVAEDIIFALNSRYLIDFLSNIEKNQFTLHFNASTLPFMVESEGFKTVIMTIMI